MKPAPTDRAIASVLPPASPRWSVALVISCLALALSVAGLMRGSSPPPVATSTNCIDQVARARTDGVVRALLARDASPARLARPADPAPGAVGEAGAAPPPASPSEQGPRRYARFESPNPAVSVTQNADGTYDVRTADPALAGSVVRVTAVTALGDNDDLLLRIPQ